MLSGVDARRIALLSTSDTDLLSARASGSYYLYGNPAKTRIDSLADQLAGCDLIILRVLGSPQTYAAEVASLHALARPLVVVGGEQVQDAALMQLSSVPIGVAAEAHVYLAQGGPQNLRQLAAFLSDTVLLTGVGFDPPIQQASWGELPRTSTGSGHQPRVGILFYRAQYAAGNKAYVEALADAVDGAGGLAVPIYATSLREATTELLAFLGTLDALITTVLAAGGTKPATASAGGNDEAWDVRRWPSWTSPSCKGSA